MNTNVIPIERESHAEYWADRVCKSHAASVEQIIQTGRELLAAKAKLSHGEWGRLTGRATGKPLLPFSPQTAHKHMLIAQHVALSNVAQWATFPTSWRTMAELAQLPPPLVEQHVTGGAIHPEMTRADAEQLVTEWRLSQAPPKPSELFTESPARLAAAAVASPPPDISPQREAELNEQLADAVTALREEADQSAAIKASVRGVPATQGAWAEVLGQLGAIADMAKVRDMRSADESRQHARRSHRARVARRSRRPMEPAPYAQGMQPSAW